MKPKRLWELLDYMDKMRKHKNSFKKEADKAKNKLEISMPLVCFKFCEMAINEVDEMLKNYEFTY